MVRRGHEYMTKEQKANIVAERRKANQRVAEIVFGACDALQDLWVGEYDHVAVERGALNEIVKWNWSHERVREGPVFVYDSWSFERRYYLVDESND